MIYMGVQNQFYSLFQVTIPERHIKYSNEHIRVVDKMKNGCRYFISQAVYNLEASKFLSDYYYYCEILGDTMVPIIFTLTIAVP